MKNNLSISNDIKKLFIIVASITYLGFLVYDIYNLPYLFAQSTDMNGVTYFDFGNTISIISAIAILLTIFFLQNKKESILSKAFNTTLWMMTCTLSASIISMMSIFMPTIPSILDSNLTQISFAIFQFAVVAMIWRIYDKNKINIIPPSFQLLFVFFTSLAFSIIIINTTYPIIADASTNVQYYLSQLIVFLTVGLIAFASYHYLSNYKSKLQKTFFVSISAVTTIMFACAILMSPLSTISNYQFGPYLSIFCGISSLLLYCMFIFKFRYQK